MLMDFILNILGIYGYHYIENANVIIISDRQ